MATGTAQLLPSRDENILISDEEIDDNELMPLVPEPVKDGLPQVRTNHIIDVTLDVGLQAFVVDVFAACSAAVIYTAFNISLHTPLLLLMSRCVLISLFWDHVSHTTYNANHSHLGLLEYFDNLVHELHHKSFCVLACVSRYVT